MGEGGVRLHRAAKQMRGSLAHMLAHATDFGMEYLIVRKVPAHRPFVDVAIGVLTYSGWFGNQQADKMDRQGAAMHPDNTAAA